MAAAEPRQIEWGSAQMQDGTLTVELTGSGSKAWKVRFENVLALLDTPHSSWGDVRLTKNAIKVTNLQKGGESELHHFLESVLLQANSDTEPDTPQRGDASARRIESRTPKSRWRRLSDVSRPTATTSGIRRGRFSPGWQLGRCSLSQRRQEDR